MVLGFMTPALDAISKSARLGTWFIQEDPGQIVAPKTQEARKLL